MILETVDSNLIIGCQDTIITIDVNTANTQKVTIPRPEVPLNATKGQLEILNKEDRSINSITASQDGKYLGISTENRQVLIYDNKLNLLKNLIVNRTASKIAFSRAGDVLIADRTGDVYLYKLFSEDNEPTLLLGHLSMILDLVLSDCEKYIVTCDRDEKIRVSHFPNTYNIVSYCLGHEEFVTTLKIVRNVLISASGDGTVRFWNYIKGEQLGCLDTNQYVKTNNMLETFIQDMDREKVDVTALPISEIRIKTDSNNTVLIAVSLFKCNYVQLYRTNLPDCGTIFLQNIELQENLFTFCFVEKLFIFTKLQVLAYMQASSESFAETDALELSNAYKKYSDLVKLCENNSLIVLYKRKFDNVQEYLHKKKARLRVK